MELSQFIFPVEERPVGVEAGVSQGPLTELPAGAYKAIVRADTNEVISIVRRTYKVISNQVLIEAFMAELATLETPYRVDESHSFVSNARMRLQVTFPEIRLQDGNSAIALSLFLHNSYDLSEGIRIFFGAIRHICTNGMVFGKVLEQFYGRHTSGFRLGEVAGRIGQATLALPGIQQRIGFLEKAPVDKGIQERVEKTMGKRLTKRVMPEIHPNQWSLYNALTHIISHDMPQDKRAHYQQLTSQVFEL
ncbi:MAG: DUF932 domain-containing protein [Calditrichaeota bacterium]|nr:DUF932 domain-containing protein [Calditrichota bacterium]